MGENTDTVNVTPGDTLEVNFILASGLQYLPDIGWKYDQETYTDTIYIVIEELLGLDIGRSQVWVEDMLMPSWMMNSNTISTALPAEVDSLQLRIFPLPDVNVLKTEFSDTVISHLSRTTLIIYWPFHAVRWRLIISRYY